MRVYEIKALANLFGGIINYKTIAGIVVFSISLSWLSDGLSDILKNYMHQSFPVVQVLAGLLGIGFLSFLVKKELEKAKDLDLDVKFVDADKTKILILFLSKLYIEDKKKEENKNEEEINKEEKINKIRTFDDLKNIILNWEMPLIAIKHHLPVLKHVVVICSERSFKEFEMFEQLVRRLFPDYEFSCERYEKPINFENIEEVYDTLKKVHKEVKSSQHIREKDITIDITGGTKIVSIAGSIFTLEVEDRKIQYISTTQKQPYILDIIKKSDT